MPYLFLAVAAAAIKGFCGKKISGYAHNISDCIRMNLFRMSLCCLIGLAMILISHPALAFPGTAELLIYLLSGASMAAFLIFWTLSVRTDAYMLVSACTTASFVIPMLFGFFLFGEHISVRQIIGMLFIAAAVILLIRYNNKIKTKLGIREILMLLIVFATQGLINATQKMFTFYVPGGNKSVFNFFTFFVAFAVLCIWQVIQILRHGSGTDHRFAGMKKILGYICVMAVMLFFNSYCLTLATEHIPSVVLYPLNSVLSLAAATVMSALCFRERITKTSAAGLICTLISLLLTKLA